MSEPIDFEDRDQVLRLALAGVFLTAAIVRGARNDPADLARVCVGYADALINAVVTPPTTP
jgi:hypothetical protein